jgi:hypothetical protein
MEAFLAAPNENKERKFTKLAFGSLSDLPLLWFKDRQLS